MRQLVLCFLLLCPLSAYAESYTFSGSIGDTGTFSGFLHYDPSAAPIATDVRGLLGNQVWGVTSWGFTITPNFGDLGVLTANALEFCTGKCIFGNGATDVTTLRIGTNGSTVGGTTSLLQLGFTPGFGEYIYPSSHFKLPSGGMLLASNSTVHGGSVPLPDQFWATLIGLIGIAIYVWRE